MHQAAAEIKNPATTVTFRSATGVPVADVVLATPAQAQTCVSLRMTDRWGSTDLAVAIGPGR
jgi:hypothetical protein